MRGAKIAAMTYTSNTTPNHRRGSCRNALATCMYHLAGGPEVWEANASDSLPNSVGTLALPFALSITGAIIAVDGVGGFPLESKLV